MRHPYWINDLVSELCLAKNLCRMVILYFNNVFLCLIEKEKHKSSILAVNCFFLAAQGHQVTHKARCLAVSQGISISLSFLLALTLLLIKTKQTCQQRKKRLNKQGKAAKVRLSLEW